MAQHLPQASRKEVLDISGPNLFHMEPLGQLTEHCIDHIALMAQPSRPGMILTFGRFEGHQPGQALSQALLSQSRTSVVAVPQDPPVNTGKQIFSHRQVVYIGGSQLEIADDARQVDVHVHPQPQEGLTSHFIPLKGSPSRQDAAAVNPGEAAHRNRQTVADRDEWIILDLPD